jgi:ketosteroid isomerase-like protein
VRQALLRLGLERAVAALNRGDHAVAFVLFAADCETDFSPGFAVLGNSATHGLKERIAAQSRFRSDWGANRFNPRELVDLGDDRVLVVGSFNAIGHASEVPIDSEWGMLVNFSRGRVIREQNFFDEHEALEAAGLAN